MAKKEQVLITQDTVANGERVKAGKLVTVEEADAKLLVSCNKGVRGKAEIEAAQADMKRRRAAGGQSAGQGGQVGTGQG